MGMAQQEVIGLDGVRGNEETANGDGGEVVGAFEDGGSGVSAFGGAVADEEAGDVVLDEALVEGGEVVAETVVGATLLVREEVDEGIEDDEAGVGALDGIEEEGKVFGEGEGAVVGGVGIGGRCGVVGGGLSDRGRAA